jgi:integrase/recombinase XerD
MKILLKNGAEIVTVSKLKGHYSSKTTEIYTHVSSKNIQHIKSPFDDL